eukprot:tig00000093_g3490.t1
MAGGPSAPALARIAGLLAFFAFGALVCSAALNASLWKTSIFNVKLVGTTANGTLTVRRSFGFAKARGSITETTAEVFAPADPLPANASLPSNGTSASTFKLAEPSAITHSTSEEVFSATSPSSRLKFLAGGATALAGIFAAVSLILVAVISTAAADMKEPRPVHAAAVVFSVFAFLCAAAGIVCYAVFFRHDVISKDVPNMRLKYFKGDAKVEETMYVGIPGWIALSGCLLTTLVLLVASLALAKARQPKFIQRLP